MNGSGWRPFPSQVRAQGLCDGGQQTKFERNIGLWPTRLRDAGLLVQTFQSNPANFGSPQIPIQLRHRLEPIDPTFLASAVARTNTSLPPQPGSGFRFCTYRRTVASSME